MNENRRDILKRFIALPATLAMADSLIAAPASQAFVCPPCGCSMDGIAFDAPGKCPACNMDLVERTETTRACCAAISSQDIEFRSSGSLLSGTLFTPTNQPPTAVIVLVHGSGRVERMTLLGRLLASEGFVVFSYDKRGVGRSQGVYEADDNTSAANLHLLAEDASSAMQAVVKVAAFSKIPHGYVGISQAGWIIPIAAGNSPAPSFMAFWSGPVCTVSEEMHFSRLAEGDPDFWKKHTPQEIERYMQSVRYRSDDIDPRTSLSRLSIPALWTFGGQDNSLPVELSIARLKSLIEQGKTEFSYEVFPDYGHNLADSSDQLSYQFVVAWIKRITAGNHG